MGKTRRIEKDLLSDERILYAASMHWAIFLFPVLVLIVGALAWVYFHPLVGGAIMAIALFPIINSAILYSTTEYGVTNKRTLAFYGLFTTDLMQIGHERLESAMIEQSFIGQILGYYTVSARGTGQGSITVPFLTDGNRLKRILDEIVYSDSREEAMKKVEKLTGKSTGAKKKRKTK